MSRHVRKVPVTVDSQGLPPLSNDEIRAIVTAADDMVYSGGRNLLAKVLKGSRERIVVERDLDKNPAYGAFKNDPLDLVLRRVDWMVERGYLAIQYDHRLPLLAYGTLGLPLAIDIRADRQMEEIRKEIAHGKIDPTPMTDPHWNRQTQLLMIERMGASGDPIFLPYLEAWLATAFTKLRTPIQNAIDKLRKTSVAPNNTIH